MAAQSQGMTAMGGSESRRGDGGVRRLHGRGLSRGAETAGAREAAKADGGGSCVGKGVVSVWRRRGLAKSRGCEGGRRRIACVVAGGGSRARLAEARQRRAAEGRRWLRPQDAGGRASRGRGRRRRRIEREN
ncbi:hypothetical protein BRADI_5g00407v3, partial [Brachypodium distachyon]